jgi:hypothetical protein
MIIAGACIIAAAFLLLRRNLDAAFVVAALGLVAWFLNYRAQMKVKIKAAEAERSRVDGEENGEDLNED